MNSFIWFSKWANFSQHLIQSLHYFDHTPSVWLLFELLLLLQQNRKYKVVNTLAYLPRLDIAMRPNNKSGLVSGNSMDHSYLLHVYPQ
jgi:hypothetical protein